MEPRAQREAGPGQGGCSHSGHEVWRSRGTAGRCAWELRVWRNVSGDACPA